MTKFSISILPKELIEYLSLILYHSFRYLGPFVPDTISKTHAF